MSSLAKFLVTVGMIVGFFFLFGVIVVMKEQSGSSIPLFFGVILFFGLFAGIKAVWKKPKEENDNHHLDKR